MGLLNIPVQDATTQVGLTCSPISVVGLGGSSCGAQTVCCENNSYVSAMLRSLHTPVLKTAVFVGRSRQHRLSPRHPLGWMVPRLPARRTWWRKARGRSPISTVSVIAIVAILSLIHNPLKRFIAIPYELQPYAPKRRRHTARVRLVYEPTSTGGRGCSATSIVESAVDVWPAASWHRTLTGTKSTSGH